MMTNMIVAQGTNTTTMSSREIADLTGKELSNVHRDIRAMLDELGKDGSNLNHPRVERDARGYTTCFHLDRELTETLLTGYSASARFKVIRRWHELEDQVGKPSELSRLDILKLAIDSEQARLEADRQLAIAQPKIAFVDRYVEATGLKGFRQVAKLLNIKEREFRDFLRSYGVMYKLNGEWVANQKHICAGRFSVRTGVAEVSGHAYNSCQFTAKGIAWVAGLMASFKASELLNSQSVEIDHAR